MILCRFIKTFDIIQKAYHAVKPRHLIERSGLPWCVANDDTTADDDDNDDLDSPTNVSAKGAIDGNDRNALLG